DGTTQEAITNYEKSRLIAKSFFPPPPLHDPVPPDTIYPDPVEQLPPITPDQVTRAIAKLSGYKVPGPDGICNIVFKECAGILTPYLTHLFNAVYSHHVYYQPWCCFSMVVLRKPGKPNYSIPKAYQCKDYNLASMIANYHLC
ncbi:hypothetical protein BDR04DRAFT_1029046, partial [Suillus decipiens]